MNTLEEGDFCYAKAITAYEIVPHSRPEEDRAGQDMEGETRSRYTGCGDISIKRRGSIQIDGNSETEDIIGTGLQMWSLLGDLLCRAKVGTGLFLEKKFQIVKNHVMRLIF